MNDPSSDGNELVIDIFVLCKSETDISSKTDYLEQKGYHVTLFSDSAQLLETLRFGKPNLLVCDSLSLGPEAFEVCRQIKADNDLWMIPVLIVTGAASLGDLLFVLDCNADNFIAHPYDPPYLLSLIEGMLNTPVERQTPEQIKTQFKIQHDEHMFVVTADRRKLLEFLLSSFEIAVNKSEELFRSVSTNADLRQAITKADEVASEQGRVISIMNTTLQQREHALSALNDELKEKANQIAEHIREKGFFLNEREADKGMIAQAEDKIRALTSVIEEMERSHSAETGDLSQRIAALSGELSTATTDLATTKGTLDQEMTRRKDAEATLEKLVPEKEQLEKTLRALTLECEQVRSSWSAEQNRALAAEQENKSLIQAKTESEQDLTRIIDELKDTARQQAGELVTLREERVLDRNRISTLETRAASLAAEKEQLESSLKKTADDLRRDLSDLRSACDSATASGEEKTRRITELEQAVTGQKNAGDLAQAQVSALESELVAVRSTLEEKTRSAADMEQVCFELKNAGSQALAQIHSLDNEVEELRAAVDVEKQQHAATRASLQGALAERDTALSSLQGAHAEVKSDLDSHRDNLVQVKQELSSAVNERNSLTDRLSESSAQIHVLEEKLRAASGDQAESDKHIRSLSEELEQARAALETERRQRRTVEENIRNAAAAGEKAEETMRISQKEQERNSAMLESEREERRNAEERLRALEAASEIRMHELNTDLAEAATRQRELEEQVRLITKEKLEAEKQAAALEAEIDQARSALADEWEEHMKDNERFASVAENKQRPEPVQPLNRPEPVAGQSRAVISRAPDFPVEVKQSPRSVMAVPVPPQESGTRRVTGVEDLFEDDEDSSEDTEELPVVSIVCDPAPEVTLDIIPCPPVSDEPEFDEALEPDGGAEDEDGMPSPDLSAGDESDESVDDDGDTDSGVHYPPVPATPGIAFDRTKWFDLLKWAHHSGALSQDQRLQIVRMGRLIQKGRRLTRKQDEQVREMIGLVQSLGYRFM